MTKDQKKLAKKQKPGQKKNPEVEEASNSRIVENERSIGADTADPKVIQQRKRRETLMPANIEAIQRLRRTGGSIEDIHKLTGFGVATVSKYTQGIEPLAKYVPNGEPGDQTTLTTLTPQPAKTEAEIQQQYPPQKETILHQETKSDDGAETRIQDGKRKYSVVTGPRLSRRYQTLDPAISRWNPGVSNVYAKNIGKAMRNLNMWESKPRFGFLLRRLDC